MADSDLDTPRLKPIFGSDAVTPNASDSGPRPRDQLRVFWMLAQLVMMALLAFAMLAVFRPLLADRFGTIVLGPLMTILAGAVGYYFGAKSQQASAGASSKSK